MAINYYDGHTFESIQQEQVDDPMEFKFGNWQHEKHEQSSVEFEFPEMSDGQLGWELSASPFAKNYLGAWTVDETSALNWEPVDTNWYWTADGCWRRSTGTDSDIFVGLPADLPNRDKIIEDFNEVSKVTGHPVTWDGTALIVRTDELKDIHLFVGNELTLHDGLGKDIHKFTLTQHHIPATYLPTSTITNAEPIHFEFGSANSGLTMQGTQDLLKQLAAYESYPKQSVVNQAEKLKAEIGQRKTKVFHVYIEALKAYKVVGYIDNMKMEALISKHDSEWLSEQHNFFGSEWKSFWYAVNRCMAALNNNNPGDGGYWSRKRIPLLEKLVKHPVIQDDSDGPYELPLMQVITNLNDIHHWTREQIADWLDTLDEQPIFYPRAESESVGNTAFLVTLQPALQEGIAHHK